MIQQPQETAPQSKNAKKRKRKTAKQTEQEEETKLTKDSAQNGPPTTTSIDPALTHVPSLAVSQPDKKTENLARRGRHKVDKNDPIPSKDRIKEEVRSVLGDEKVVEEFVEFTEEYK